MPSTWKNLVVPFAVKRVAFNQHISKLGNAGFAARIFIAFVVGTLRGTGQVRAFPGSSQGVDACLR